MKAQNGSDFPISDPRLSIDEIFILGNKKTKEKIILREMSLKKGTYGTLDDIKKSIELDKINIHQYQFIQYRLY